MIPEGHKFAALSLYGTGTHFEMPEVVSLPKGLIASRRLPFEVTDWWREQLGLLACEEIEHSDLFLLSVAPSKSLSVLDAENEELEDSVRNFFYGLLISIAFSPELAPQLVTGSMESGKATFRQIGRFERPVYIAGTPPPDINSKIIEDAAFYANAIHSITLRQGIYGRAIWALNCYMNGVTSTHVFEKMRHFVRTIEAFLLPEIGKTERQFKSRTELFLGPGEHDLVSTIYKVRSNIEHLHDPLVLMGGLSRRDRLIALCEVTLITECLARYCIQRFLKKKDLQPHFESDASIEAFWNLPGTDRATVWGPVIDMTWVRQQFDKSLANAVVS